MFRTLSLLETEAEAVSVTMGIDLVVARPIVRKYVITFNSYYLTRLPISKTLIVIVKGLGAKTN
jgi:hypothetical protein